MGKTKRGKDGSGRWPGRSAGGIAGLGVPGRGDVLEKTLATAAVGRPGKAGRPRKRPDQVIADRAVDSNLLRKRLKWQGIEPIIPARRNHRRATDQDGRKLRRYRHRWIVGRTFAWIGSFRRLVVRYERLFATYAGSFHLACALLTLRMVLK